MATLKGGGAASFKGLPPMNPASIGLDRQRSTVMVCTVANAIVAWPWMHCQGHVAHGTDRLYYSVSVSTQFTQPWACGLGV